MAQTLLSWTLVITAAAALIGDVPGLNGPIPTVRLQDIAFGKRRTSEFIHPGIWHTHEDLERIREGVVNGCEPWASAYVAFSADSYSQSNYSMQGPESVISRGLVSNFTTFANDSRAAWQNALMWYITKKQNHWLRATSILDAWGTNLTNIIGTDRSLLVGLDGQLFVNAAEIMRWEGNWTEAGAQWQGGSGFSIQLYWLFARQSIINGQANYGMASISALLSFAVYLDDITMYNYALNLYQNDLCAGIHGNVDAETGQGAEAGRDQSHAQSALAWASTAARTVQSQGGDLYSYEDNILLKGAEYAACYNLNYTVKYDPSYFRCEAVLVNGPWSVISDIRRGLSRPVWNMLYYPYVQKMGLNSPCLEEAFRKAPLERRFTNGDLPSWGDLLWPYRALNSSQP
ncbi:chondroitin AC/alginate lyase [Elsinoe ampelina]|uniref:Chondroitin AC/alginate lyase n=1 Tax=Elsinoe ampelina TaxID=302913 RepID=A0A6A6G3T1_9PEZI|nr:chondroitin AC/alginate lyase [Elsinoe ampelina]